MSITSAGVDIGDINDNPQSDDSSATAFLNAMSVLTVDLVVANKDNDANINALQPPAEPSLGPSMPQHRKLLPPTVTVETPPTAGCDQSTQE